MANTVNLTQVNFTELNDNINLIVENDSELKRLSISDLGSDISIDLNDSINSESNPINADTLNGYEFEYFASQNNLNEAIENIDKAIKNIDDTIAIRAEEIIGNLDIGPKVELNYSIVGGLEEPAEPTENMIWVNTDKNFNQVFINYNQPINANDNDIWLQTTSSKNSLTFPTFNINNIIFNDITICRGFQFINSSWNEISIKFYNNNEWKDLYIYLYSSGDSCTSITGGWVKRNTCNGTIQLGSNSLQMDINGVDSADTYGILHTAKAIDLTEVNTIFINPGWITSNNNATYATPRFGVASTIPDSQSTVRNGIVYTSSNNLLDVSGLSGLYYIYVGSAFNGNSDYKTVLNITQIYMQ